MARLLVCLSPSVTDGFLAPTEIDFVINAARLLKVLGVARKPTEAVAAAVLLLVLTNCGELDKSELVKAWDYVYSSIDSALMSLLLSYL